MKTKITEMLGIKYPIVLAGMAQVSNAELALAVSQAGGLGIIATFGMTPEELRQSIHYVRERTDKPFGANIYAGDPREEELASVIIEERVRVISHGRGNPSWLLRATQTYDCVTIPTAGALKHAVRLEQDGANIVVVQGWEGGGHTGGVASLILIPMVVSQVKIPVIAAGGFCDGQGLAVALAMGAEGVYMGTRFAATKESPLNETAKQRLLQLNPEDIKVTTHITGHTCRMINNKLVKRAEHPLSIFLLPFQALVGAIETAREIKVSLRQLYASSSSWRKAYDASFKDMMYAARTLSTLKRGVVMGDVEMGMVPMGQVAGRIKDIPTCQEVIEQIMREAEATLEKMKAVFAA